MPLQDHLIEQGFLDFVRSKKASPLFYSVARQRGASGGNPTYLKVDRKLAEWVRAVGVDDENVQPNHGWRHRFEAIGRAVGIDSAKLDAIQGHAPATESDKYWEFIPNALKVEVDEVPPATMWWQAPPSTVIRKPGSQIRRMAPSNHLRREDRKVVPALSPAHHRS